VLVLALGLGMPLGRAEGDLLARCEAYASAHEALPLMAWSGVFHDDALNALLADVAAGDVKRVLASEDPRVRTLGAVALSVGDDPSRLRMISPLVDDERPSFACTHRASVAFVQRPDGTFGPSGPPTFTEPWTVARWARFQLKQWSNVDRRDAAAWQAWWSDAGDVERTVSVWHRRLSRGLEADRAHRGAGGEGTPALEKTFARLREEQGDVLFALAALTYEESSPGPWTEEERETIAREHLSTDFALACLKREPSFSDPWVRPGEYAYAWLCRRLLLALSFTPAQAATLLALEKVERGREPSLANEAWSIAASRALPDREAKRDVLVAAYARYGETWEQHSRYRIACELWRALGADALDIVLAWYFDEREPYINSGGFQEGVAECVGRSGEVGRRFVAAVLADERSRDLPWASLEALARACNELAGEAIVSEHELTNLHHPLGSYHFSRDAGLAAAREKHPDATAKVLHTLATWHTRLKAYVTSHGW